MTTARSNSSAGPAVLVAGMLFLDVVFADLPAAPRLGEEQWTADFGWGPGGIANFAITAARLGSSTAISAAIGDDPLSDLCRSMLETERIDVAGLRAVPGWRVPVTAALGYDADRALVTGGTPSPLALADVLAGAPAAAVATVHMEPGLAGWVRSTSAAGTRIFADLGWDGTGDWDPAVLDELDGCHAFLPNDREAMAYTRTDEPLVAARVLAERVPLSVVTLGGRGVVAVDAATGEEVVAAPVPIRAVDTTGAGDVFGAALATATLTGWDLRSRVDFAALVAAITVSRPGGAAGAPRCNELIPWLDARPETDGGRFGFLRDALSGTSDRLPLVGVGDPDDPAHAPTGPESPLALPTPTSR